MNKLINFTLCVLAAGFAVTARAGYMLYWDTEGYGDFTDNALNVPEGGDPNTYATLYYMSSLDETAGTAVDRGTLYYYGGDRILGATALSDDYKSGYFYIDITDSGKLAYSGLTVGKVASYADLEKAGNIRNLAGGDSYWHAAGIPEPTGGMLLLLGAALLGLRRKSPADSAESAE